MRQIGLWLDSDTVRHYQTIVYIGYIVAGVQSLALGSPPNAVAQSMGRSTALVWTLLVIVAPAMSLLGQWRTRAASSLWLQLAGDSAVTFATAAYVMAVLQSTWFARATFAAWMAMSITVCGAMKTWRDIWQIWLVSQRMRELATDRVKDQADDADE